MNVTTFDGIIEKKECFVYIMHDSFPIEMPSPYYIETCTEGYRDFGFDEKYLNDTLNETEKRIDTDI